MTNETQQRDSTGSASAAAGSRARGLALGVAGTLVPPIIGALWFAERHVAFAHERWSNVLAPALGIALLSWIPVVLRGPGIGRPVRSMVAGLVLGAWAGILLAATAAALVLATGGAAAAWPTLLSLVRVLFPTFGILGMGVGLLAGVHYRGQAPSAGAARHERSNASRSSANRS